MMKLSSLKPSGYLVAGCLVGVVASTVYLPLQSALARHTLTSYADLSEVQAYIRVCRKVNLTVPRADVYDNTDLSAKPANRIASLYAGDRVRLTGVLREVETGSQANQRTAVQIYLPNGRLSDPQPVGWIEASKLTECQ